MTGDVLTPDQASIIAGVPAEQLRRWAWDRVGPRNIGTRYTPKYSEEDVIAWRSAKDNHPGERLASKTLPNARMGGLREGHQA